MTVVGAGHSKASILANLEPMFEEAKAKGLWFFSLYQGLWFSPSQVRALHAEGRFIWGPTNWLLRDPHDRIADAERAVKHAKENLAAVEAELAKAAQE